MVLNASCLKTALIYPNWKFGKPKSLLWEVYEPFSPYSKKIWIIIKKLAEINNND